MHGQMERTEWTRCDRSDSVYLQNREGRHSGEMSGTPALPWELESQTNNLIVARLRLEIWAGGPI